MLSGLVFDIGFSICLLNIIVDRPLKNKLFAHEILMFYKIPTVNEDKAIEDSICPYNI